MENNSKLKCKTINNYIFCLSKRKGKKYDVYRKDDKQYITSFGAKGSDGIYYSHYFDKIGLLPKTLNHKSEKRRALYYARHGTDYKYESSGWFASKFLW